MLGWSLVLPETMYCADWSCMDGVVDNSPGGFWIDYIRSGLEDGQSIVAAPVTGSFVSSTLFSCRDVLPAGYQVLSQKISERWAMDADCLSAVDIRAVVTFGVELYVPWDAPEAVVEVSSAHVVPLRGVPDVIGLVGRRDSAVESHVLQGRDARSIRVLVPDCQGLDQNFHNITIVDMGDLPESYVSMPELSDLMHKWPPGVINHMMWRQRELEEMRKAAKIKYRPSHLSPCTFCGTLIRCDMYQHVARCHLELAQLWRLLGTFAHPGATPASTHDSEGGKLSVKRPNVQRRTNHEICESYPSVHPVGRPAETLRMEGLDASTIVRPCQ